MPALLWLFFNASVNRHFHISDGGFVITHAHPFSKTTPGPSSSPVHHHEKKELLLLSLFSEVACLLVLLFMKDPGLKRIQGLLQIRMEYGEPLREHYQVYHYHAPPLV